MDISNRDILELLDGNRTYPEEKRKEFFSMIDKKIRDDFINDLAIVMAGSDFEDELSLPADIFCCKRPAKNVEYLERLVHEIECLKKLAPEIDKIFRDRADSLKKKLINARIREFKKHSDDKALKTPFHVSDWEAVRKRLKAVRFDNDVFALFDKVTNRVTNENIFNDELFIFESDDAETTLPPEASDVVDIGEIYNRYDALLNSAAVNEEIIFAKSISEDIALSYLINVSDNLLNEMLFNAIKNCVSHRNRTNVKHRFICVSEFKNQQSRNDRFEEKGFDYDDFAEYLDGSILCVTNFDLLPSLSSSEFNRFREFLKEKKRYNFFFFGDFDHPTAGFKNRMDELELILNIRKIDAKKIELDEKESLRAAFASRKLIVPEGIKAVMLDAWSAYRNIRRDDQIEDVEKEFVIKTEFNAFSKKGECVPEGFHILDGDMFEWIGNSYNPGTGSGASARPASLELLDKMIGMSEVKKEAEQFVSRFVISKMRENAGLPVEPTNLSLLFLGNPGTGKTTTARILASAFKELGILKKGHLVTASRETLVAPYIGQTARLVHDIFFSALDGVLFIDEAYSLYTAELSLDSFGKEAVNTLTLLMSEFAGRICVIMAGYEHEMDYMLSSVNPGLRDRFVYKLRFRDYSPDELWFIFCSKMNHAAMAVEPAGELLIRRKIDAMYAEKDEKFGNARAMDNLFQILTNIQASRLVSEIYPGRMLSLEQLSLLTVRDCEKAVNSNIINCAFTENKTIGFAV